MVISPNEVKLNNVTYPLCGELQPQLISNFPDKSVVGDYTADSNPLASSWVTYDLLGGIGSSTYDVGSEKHCWWTNCIVEYEGNITLPRLATAITNFAGGTVTPTWKYASSVTGTGWTTPTLASNNDTTDYAYATASASPGSAYLYVNFPIRFYGQFRIWWGNGTDTITLTAEGYNPLTAAWDSFYSVSSTGTGGAYATVNITDGFYSIVRLKASSAGDYQCRIYEVQMETAQPAAATGTLSKAINFNGNLYWSMGAFLLKLSADRTNFLPIAQFPASIVDLVPSIGGNLYIYLGDTANYHYMTVGESLTVSNSALAYWGFQWDAKLFKVASTGACAYSVNPNAASPTWTTDASLADFASNIRSFILGDDFMEGTIPYCATNYSLKFLNFTDTVWADTALKLPGLANGGKGFCHWRDGLYVSSGLDVIKFQSAQVPQISNISMLKGGGIPLEYNGHIVKLCGDGVNEMFALVDASQVTGTQKSGLYSWDDIGWKCWWVDTNNDGAMYDVIVSNASSSYAVYWACGTSIYYIDIPQGIRNPTYLTSTAYAASGSLFTSSFDGGWLVGDKRANKVRVGTKGVSATETLVLKYRTNKVNTDLSTGWTTLGTITSGTETAYTFGSGLGEIFSSIQFDVYFARGSTNTNTPILKYLTLEYNKLVPKAWGWQMTLDCSETYHDVPSKTLLENLITAAETQTLLPFVFQDTTYYVEIVSVQGARLTGESNKGKYTIFIREVM
jgi:hypothetical protein